MNYILHKNKNSISVRLNNKLQEEHKTSNFSVVDHIASRAGTARVNRNMEGKMGLKLKFCSLLFMHIYLFIYCYELQALKE